jgi:S-adenosylmethionine:tRNA ribosyltransferase-isomerase
MCERVTEGKMGGARVELLFLHPFGDGRWAALGKGNRPFRVGDQLRSATLTVRVSSKEADGTLLLAPEGDVESVLLEEGLMPIPPYMDRPGDEADVERYQTVFAEELGSAAAPTAGLHLTEAMLTQMEERGAEIGRLTLHVGVGTFRPVVADDLDQHRMHHESIQVTEDLVDQVRLTRARGGRVVAIGTTVVRALESAADLREPGLVVATQKSTDLLIQPGYRFLVVDSLLTNFHQPRSTLLALVSAFAGLGRVREAYQYALDERYGFLSYGDAMWIPQRLSEQSEEDLTS